MKTSYILFNILMLSVLLVSAGNGQTIDVYGKVIDKVTQEPLYGVNVCLKDDPKGIGTITNENGEFKLWNLPGDTINVLIRCDGYQPYILEITPLSNSSQEVNEIYLESETSKDHKPTSFLFRTKNDNKQAVVLN